MRLQISLSLILLLCFQTACTQIESFRDKSNGQGFAGRVEDPNPEPSDKDRKIANYSNSYFICSTETKQNSKLVLFCQIYIREENETITLATHVEKGVQFSWQLFSSALADINPLANCKVTNGTLSFSCEVKNEDPSLLAHLNIILSVTNKVTEETHVISKPVEVNGAVTTPSPSNTPIVETPVEEPEEIVLSKVTWTGAGGNSNWTTAANWEGGVLPGTNDTAYFGSECGLNCTVTINQDISIKGMFFSSTFNGTVTQGAGRIITVGSYGWTHNGGAFTGGDANITVFGAIALSGGNFTSTSGKLILPGGATSGIVFTLDADGVFVHHMGTVEVIVGAITSPSYTWELSKALNLYHLTINYRVDYGSAALIASGAAVNIEANLTQIAGYIVGTFNLFGNLIVGTSSNSGGMGSINFVGSDVQTYSSSGGRCAGITVNNVNGVVPAPGTTELYIFRGKLNLNSGSFTAPSGVFTVDVGSMPSGDIFTVASDASYIHNSGTLVFGGGQGGHVPTGYPENNYAFNLAQPLELHNLTSKFRPDYASANINVPSSQTVNVRGVFTQNTGYFAGNYNVYGDVTQMNAPYYNGSYSLSFKGAGTQVWTRQTANHGGTGNISIDKTGGAVSLASNIDLAGIGQGLTLTSGTLNLNGFLLTVKATLNIGTSGVLTLNGGSHTEATFINNGIVN